MNWHVNGIWETQCWNDFRLGKCSRLDGFEEIHGGNGFVERNVKGETLLEFCNEKKLCVATTWFKKKEKRKKKHTDLKEIKTEIDFVLVGRNDKVFERF